MINLIDKYKGEFLRGGLVYSKDTLDPINFAQDPTYLSFHVEFLNSLPSFNSPTRMLDSNTSQHKKNGCPMCKVPDDYSQLYISPDKRSKGGLRVKGLVYRPQSKKILTTKCGVTRKK